MEVSVTSSEGLKRQIRVIIGQSELDNRFTTRLGEVKNTVQMKGFRQGKVPAAHIKKLYGRSLMAEVVQKAVEETSQQVLADRKERPALQPKFDFTEDKDEIERVFSGSGDFAYSMSFEVLPAIPLVDFENFTRPKRTFVHRRILKVGHVEAAIAVVGKSVRASAGEGAFGNEGHAGFGGECG